MQVVTNCVILAGYKIVLMYLFSCTSLSASWIIGIHFRSLNTWSSKTLISDNSLERNQNWSLNTLRLLLAILHAFFNIIKDFMTPSMFVIYIIYISYLHLSYTYIHISYLHAPCMSFVRSSISSLIPSQEQNGEQKSWLSHDCLPVWVKHASFHMFKFEWLASLSDKPTTLHIRFLSVGLSVCRG